MNDPEFEAMAAIARALSGLEDETQQRVLKWAADKFGVPLAAAPAMTHPPTGGKSDGASRATASAEDHEEIDEAAVMTAVAEETGVPVEKLERVFHLDGGVVKLLGPTSRYGTRTTDQARAVAQIVSVVRRVGMGLPDTPFDIIKDACESKHCYDRGNFASFHLKNIEGFVVKGEKKDRRLEPRAAGISAFASLIDSILGQT